MGDYVLAELVAVGSPGRGRQVQGVAKESEHGEKGECASREGEKVVLGVVFENGNCCSCNFLNRSRVINNLNYRYWNV